MGCDPGGFWQHERLEFQKSANSKLDPCEDYGIKRPRGGHQLKIPPQRFRQYLFADVPSAASTPAAQIFDFLTRI